MALGSDITALIKVSPRKASSAVIWCTNICGPVAGFPVPNGHHVRSGVGLPAGRGNEASKCCSLVAAATHRGVPFKYLTLIRSSFYLWGINRADSKKEQTRSILLRRLDAASARDIACGALRSGSCSPLWVLPPVTKNVKLG
jgi:hypothetical protein